MRRYDNHLFRNAIGFDKILNALETVTSEIATFPPYNIERINDDETRLTLALAGYDESELSIETKEGVLVIKGEKPAGAEDRIYLHQGIANRSFERKFSLADYMEVKSASLSNGLLTIDRLREVPEAKKPRKIDISK